MTEQDRVEQPEQDHPADPPGEVEDPFMLAPGEEAGNDDFPTPEEGPDPTPEESDSTPEDEQDTTPEVTVSDRQKAITEVYTEALRTLRQTHKDEFNELRRKLLADRGIEWSPQVSKAERAEQEVRRLLTENPGLAARLGIPKR